MTHPKHEKAAGGDRTTLWMSVKQGKKLRSGRSKWTAQMLRRGEGGTKARRGGVQITIKKDWGSEKLKEAWGGAGQMEKGGAQKSGTKKVAPTRRGGTNQRLN